jgi:hypothetical protein
MCKLAEQNFNADREITKLVNQINDLKQSAEEDSNTNADMYTAMQTKLVSREEVVFVHKGNQSIKTPSFEARRIEYT